MALQKLVSILKPPLSPVDAEKINWVSVENKIGTKLPDDYKEFLRIFGTGSIDDFFWIYTPFTRHGNINLFSALKRETEKFAYIQSAGHEKFPYKIWPDRHGLLPVCATDNGDTIYWKTEEEPDEWTIVFIPARSDEYEEFNLSLTVFLAKLLSKKIKMKGLPDDVPSDDPQFASV